MGELTVVTGCHQAKAAVQKLNERGKSHMHSNIFNRSDFDCHLSCRYLYAIAPFQNSARGHAAPRRFIDWCHRPFIRK